jgi:triacylglycerol esterase/lipase EstA (alpha/beta hydrolase family)
MSVNLEPTFGKSRQNVATQPLRIFLLHGFLSKPEAMHELENLLAPSLQGARFDRFAYDWKQSVLLSGAELANAVFSLPDAKVPVYLIGHSMGGLVCRVANVILADPKHFSSLIPSFAALGFQDDINFLKSKDFGHRTPRPINGVITLATPNSGTMLQGQVSSLLAAIQFGIGRFSSLRHQSVVDLTTERLFNLMQLFSVSNPALSISGSLVNRFRTGAGQMTKYLGQFGLNLTLPHDGIVEDVTVDMTRSILPNEFVHHGSSPYLHLRAYEDCTSVAHCTAKDIRGIHCNRIVADYIADFIARC